MRFMLFLALAACAAQAPAIRSAPPPGSELVLATFRAQPGKEAELARLLGEHWRLVQRLGLVVGEPHLVLRGEDEPGKTVFLQVLVWKSADTPDHAPPEVQAIWAKLGALVESRGGHPGIEFPEMTQIEP